MVQWTEGQKRWLVKRQDGMKGDILWFLNGFELYAKGNRKPTRDFKYDEERIYGERLIIP